LKKNKTLDNYLKSCYTVIVIIEKEKKMALKIEIQKSNSKGNPANVKVATGKANNRAADEKKAAAYSYQLTITHFG
jgi:hypothetical protein